jgi:pyridine nucleotide-disulfide oxidoreductase family protein
MKTLILAGGGHAHLHVLKALMAGGWPGVEVILISPYSRQIYSGMVPGWMAGHYSLEQCAARLLPLVRVAKVRFIQDAVTGVSAGQRVVHTAHSGDIPYDVLSLDAGAGVDASFLAASGAVVLPIRPLESFVVGWEAHLARIQLLGRANLIVVGGGAAGVELALAARYRLVSLLGEQQVSVRLIAGNELMAGHSANVVDRTARVLAQQGVEVIYGYAAGAADGVQLADGRLIDADCIIAATGVCPAGWLAETGLALCKKGFVSVGDGQQSISHREVFAAGDISTRLDAPHARSGVYAVRAGPVLTRNLQLALMGQPPTSYLPQKRSLYLLASGPKRAIMSWGGVVAEGGWAWRWKDWIDRRFMRQYDLALVTRSGENI